MNNPGLTTTEYTEKYIDKDTGENAYNHFEIEAAEVHNAAEVEPYEFCPCDGPVDSGHTKKAIKDGGNKSKLFDDLPAMTNFEWLRWSLMYKCKPDSEVAVLLQETMADGMGLLDALVIVIMFDKKTRLSKIKGYYRKRKTMEYPLMKRLSKVE